MSLSQHCQSTLTLQYINNNDNNINVYTYNKTNVTTCHGLLGVTDTDSNIGGSADQCYDLSLATGGQIQTLTLGAQLTNVMTCHGLLGVRDTDSNT